MSGAATDIAVIGMSCRFPGVHGLSDFWRLLIEGKSTVGTFPEHRAVDANSTYTSHPDGDTLDSGSFFDSIDGFDAGFFDTSAAEAAAMDPVQRLGLELAWEAVEDAGVPAASLTGRAVDVVVGAAPSGYELLRKLSGSDQDDHYAALGSSGALIANRISNLFDVRGMSYCADSGQSSSLVSLSLACDRIRGGAVDMAIAGGVHLIADPEAGAGLANLGALSPDGRCFTFDERASGFARGEGGAFVVLKRLDLAVADGDHIYAVVRGWGVGSGGASSRMPDPSPAGQAAAVLAALERAAVPFDGVDYVEAHGTGTRVGDPAEISGLREVIKEAGGRSRPLAIGSVKTNVGHLEPAAGIVGFVKAALCVDRAHLVPSLNFRSPNPAIADFHQDFEVLRAARPWPGEPGRPRRAGVSAFGLGGTNAHVILEQAPGDRAQLPPTGADLDTPAHSGAVPWVLSARSEPALKEQAARLRDLVAADTSLSAVDVGHALVSRRSSFEHRAVVLSGSREEALAGLDLVAEGGGSERAVRGTATDPSGPVVFVFPGQGSQWLGMGRRLYAESEVFARAIDACERALAPHVDWSLVDVVRGEESAASLDRVDVVQPTLFAMMVSLAQVWRSLGVVPEAVVGHSQGEIAAACVSGALSLEDAARIVALRSRALIDLAGPGGMSAVAAPVEWVRDRLEHWSGRLSAAAVNGPASVVISGDNEALDQFAEMAAGDGVRVRRVRVDYASHSHHVERIRERLLADTAGITPKESAVKFYSTVTGGLLDTRVLDGSYWYDNLRSMVRFGEVVEGLMREHGGVFVEVSPHPVLQVAMEEAADALAAPPTVVSTLHKQDGSAGKVLASLAELHVRGLPVNWKAVFAADRPRRVALPTYAFQRQRYWLSASDDTGATSDPSAQAGAAPADLGSQSAVLALVRAETAALLAAGGVALTEADLTARSAETFKDLGFDSSMAVRLRNRLTAAAGVRLPATVAFTYPTVRKLGLHIFSLLEPRTPEVPEPPAPEVPAADAVGETSPEDRSDDDLYALIERGYA
ncbi:acyltransferase domain-containing protein [Streptomyces sp. NPDC059900]|uniref:type I polyketide synthase n=1 Tax=Streptomyces sp. NPDC059900 TaxID=3155816 RepID=UPI0034200B28